MKIIMLNDGSFMKLDNEEYKQLVTNKSIEKEIKVKKSSMEILKERVVKCIRKNNGITLGKVLNRFRSKQDFVINILDDLEKNDSIKVKISYHKTNGDEVKSFYIK